MVHFPLSLNDDKNNDSPFSSDWQRTVTKCYYIANSNGGYYTKHLNPSHYYGDFSNVFRLSLGY